jgi:hypothetical protein
MNTAHYPKTGDFSRPPYFTNTGIPTCCNSNRLQKSRISDRDGLIPNTPKIWFLEIIEIKNSQDFEFSVSKTDLQMSENRDAIKSVQKLFIPKNEHFPNIKSTSFFKIPAVTANRKMQIIGADGFKTKQRPKAQTPKLKSKSNAKKRTLAASRPISVFLALKTHQRTYGAFSDRTKSPQIRLNNNRVRKVSVQNAQNNKIKHFMYGHNFLKKEGVY